MNRVISPIFALYLALTALFVGTNFVLVSNVNEPAHQMVKLKRNSGETFGGLAPNGIWEPDYALLRRSVNVLPAVSFAREFGNSVRLALGQEPDWVFAGGGGDNALFLTGELWVSRGVTPRIEGELKRVAATIGQYNKQLENDGWRLIVVPVPTKLGIHRNWAHWPVGGSDLLDRDPVTEDRSDDVYRDFLAALRAQHVTSVDLQQIYRAAMAQDQKLILYPPGESHWSGEGIRLAADATAQAIASVSSLKARTPSHATFFVEDHIGDLCQAFDPLPWFTTRLRSVWSYRDRLLEGEEGRNFTLQPENPAGLVVAVGTSYTGQYTWIPRPVGFAGQLGHHLDNVEVQNRPMAGQGSFKSFEYFWNHRDEIADDFSHRTAGEAERIVVWEMPIRDIPGIGESTLSWSRKNGWY